MKLNNRFIFGILSAVGGSYRLCGTSNHRPSDQWKRGNRPYHPACIERRANLVRKCRGG